MRIETRKVPLGSHLLRGMIETYEDESIISIDGTLNSAWIRYVFAKEACHYLLKDDGFHTTDPISVIEDFLLDESGINGSNDPALDVQAESLTKFAAIELLFPIEFRGTCKAEVNANKKSIYDISTHFDIPEHLVQFALTDFYMNFSKKIWEEKCGITVVAD